jgi:hypothetical protein
MRDVTALANQPTADRVSGFNFRSEEEVEHFLKSLEEQQKGIGTRLDALERLFASQEVRAAGEIRIDRGGGGNVPSTDTVDIGRISIPNMKKLHDNFSIVTDLTDKLDMMDTLDVQVQHLFRGERGNKLPAMIKQLRKGYETKLTQALQFLKTVAKKHEPKAFAKTVEAAMNFFQSGLKNKFSAAEEHVFVNTARMTQPDGQEHTVFVFTHYVQFTNLHNDHTDYTYPTYVVVFTARVNEKGQMQMYVNTLHKFRPPGTFKVGHEFRNLRDAEKKLRHLFEIDDFVDLLDRQPVPVTKDELRLGNFVSKGFIKDVKIDVEDHSLQVLFNSKVTGKNFADVVSQTLLDLRGALSLRTTTTLRYKPAPDRRSIDIILPIPSGADPKKFLTRDKVEHMKDTFGMDDQDIRNLMRAFHRGH